MKNRPTTVLAKTFLALLLASSVFVIGAAKGPTAYRTLAATGYELKSPNGKTEVSIQTGEHLTYDVRVNGKTLLQGSRISIDIDHKIFGSNPRVEAVQTTTVDRENTPVVLQKFSKLREHYNELRLEMAGNYAVVFRAYDEGVAYRLETSLPQSKV